MSDRPQTLVSDPIGSFGCGLFGFLLLPGVIGVIEAFSHSIYHIVREL